MQCWRDVTVLRTCNPLLHGTSRSSAGEARNTMITSRNLRRELYRLRVSAPRGALIISSTLSTFMRPCAFSLSACPRPRGAKFLVREHTREMHHRGLCPTRRQPERLEFTAIHADPLHQLQHTPIRLAKGPSNTQVSVFEKLAWGSSRVYL